MEIEWSYLLPKSSQARKNPPPGEGCKAISWPTPGVREKIFGSLGFSVHRGDHNVHVHSTQQWEAWRHTEPQGGIKLKIVFTENFAGVKGDWLHRRGQRTAHFWKSTEVSSLNNPSKLRAFQVYFWHLSCHCHEIVDAILVWCQDVSGEVLVRKASFTGVKSIWQNTEDESMIS